MPTAVFVLGFGIFAQGTSELMLAGLLPQMATDLGVTVPQAGLLISGFALGMLVGAPVLAIGTLRWPRKRAMLAFLAVFVVVHVLGALASSYAFLFATRFVGAFVYAGFWAVAASTAIALVPMDRRGRAMSVVAGGLTLATVVGLPAGTLLGEHLGWRGAFWAVAGLSTIAALAIVVAVPDSRDRSRPHLRDELRSLRTARLWRSYALTATSIASLLVTFSYLAALLTETTGVPAGWVPGFLLLYGIGSMVGIAVGGHTADRRPLGTLAVGLGGLLLVSLLLGAAGGHAVPVALLLAMLGALGFGTTPVLNSRVFGLAPAAPTLAPAFNVSSFNAGISVGPWLGGLAITAGAGYAVTPVIGAVLAAGALMLLAVEARAGRRGSSALHGRPETRAAMMSR
jgi:DHA1 family chloramphenicol resistance protein-like MFS transporter